MDELRKQGYAFQQYEEDGRLVTNILNPQGKIIITCKRRDMDYLAGRKAAAEYWHEQDAAFRWKLERGLIFITVGLA